VAGGLTPPRLGGRSRSTGVRVAGVGDGGDDVRGVIADGAAAAAVAAAASAKATETGGGTIPVGDVVADGGSGAVTDG
jgi:hypothetical protein